MLFCLWLITLMLCAVSYLVFGCDILAPSTLFIGGFLFSLTWTLLYSENWAFTLHGETFLVVLVGMLTFLFVSVVIHLVKIPRVSRFAPGKTVDPIGSFPIIPGFVVLIIVFMQAAVLILTYQRICELFPSDGLLTSISWYNNAVKFSTDSSVDTYLGFPLAPLRSMLICVGYVTTFYLADFIVNKRRDSRVLLLGVSFLLSIALQMSTGGRLPVLLQLFVLFVCVLFCYRSKNGKDLVIPKKVKRLLFVAIVLGLVLFESSAVLIGRASERDPLEYLAIYLGAQIPNLDQFIETTGTQSHGVFGYMTFISLNNWIGAKFDISSLIYPFDQPFLQMNMRDMGNVYSIFYSFYYDFGIGGIIPLTGIMAFVSQLVYESWVREKRNSFLPSFKTVVYGIIAYCVFMSFYCNRFYEDLACVAFVYLLLYILIADSVVSIISSRGSRQISSASNRRHSLVRRSRYKKMPPQSFWFIEGSECRSSYRRQD